MKTLECHQRIDPVDRLVKDLRPAEVVDWLIEYHGCKPASRETLESNLRDNFNNHRLRGRLDRHPWLAALVELWIRSKSPPQIPRPVVTPRPDRAERREAGAEAFRDRFHKVAAEVSIDLWQEIWLQACEWFGSQTATAAVTPQQEVEALFDNIIAHIHDESLEPRNRLQGVAARIGNFRARAR